MACKDCRGGGTYKGLSPFSLYVNDVRRLYDPKSNMATSLDLDKKFSCGIGGDGRRRRRIPNCDTSKLGSNGRRCFDRFKNYYSPMSDVSKIKCTRLYKDQPWFNDQVVQEGWDEFANSIVTPDNIGCRMRAAPCEYGYSCFKVRSLMGPNVECTWDLPEQDPCCPTQYGINRDWRRYNDDMRQLSSDVMCGCNNSPLCCGAARGEKTTRRGATMSDVCGWPPYLGKRYGARYMAWSQPTGLMYPRPRLFHYQSQPKVC